MGKQSTKAFKVVGKELGSFIIQGGGISVFLRVCIPPCVSLCVCVPPCVISLRVYDSCVRISFIVCVPPCICPIIANSTSQNLYPQFRNPKNSYLLLSLYQLEHENEFDSPFRSIRSAKIEKKKEEQLLEQRVKEIEAEMRHLGAMRREITRSA